MVKYNIKIHYLYHSGFAIETLNHLLIFDYYKDSFDSNPKVIENGLISDEFIKSKKSVIVFSSHRHPDHFNPVILKWQNINPDINYVLSTDIKIKNIKGNYHGICPYKSLNLNDVYIKAYGSTDIGVSFFVSVDGINIFHSGDLNLWKWKEDPKYKQERAERNFKREINMINEAKIDFAFFPVDPRLGENYSLGGKYFIEILKPKFFVPMHFWDDNDITKNFAKLTKDSPSESLIMNHIGETFEF
ncbi:MBL fold metallo-hydrolase [Clostridium ljungdahlii]|uniref:Beta-lactamase superfamily domain protein n=1 Tax=Clostridium ljungdahlii TaxID=1538 RepID=A0A170NBK1_9CLOT|nr:MBL fold metallo-hydrolase [Clostridium ljungdahlii]OAA83209.1 Beta-lactamase superfamily domain protein [Clostridium ljungdahlii]